MAPNANSSTVDYCQSKLAGKADDIEDQHWLMIYPAKVKLTARSSKWCRRGRNKQRNTRSDEGHHWLTIYLPKVKPSTKTPRTLNPSAAPFYPKHLNPNAKPFYPKLPPDTLSRLIPGLDAEDTKANADGNRDHHRLTIYLPKESTTVKSSRSLDPTAAPFDPMLSVGTLSRMFLGYDRASQSPLSRADWGQIHIRAHEDLVRQTEAKLKEIYLFFGIEDSANVSN